ncbi:MAG: glycosyltransferase family 4 protein [Roseiflexus sp.]|jgi:glycosyltransferase involved in cell wall biosynthesis|nr:glycosyltransferase family 4 protein [Roseiflexus sp.]MBO9365606.1 glycosyltransferase family 4 protein [Roseiflexus sp.]MBO9382942.1 glycosyltransferase family 4 protein [Roseiflexus sp.]MBO9390206.1 glycosyltransferase family 4 protein [Roseiflexus sp.]
MHVGIDFTAGVWQGAGIGRYTRELISAVLAQGAGIRFTLFYAAGFPGSPPPPYLENLRRLCVSHRGTRVVPIPLPPRRLTQIWHRLRIPLPIEWLTGPLDILHAPDFVPPPTRARTLVTIHDLSYMVHPECAVPGVAAYLHDAVPRALKQASIIIADSESTRRDLHRLLNIALDRVTVVYPGVDARFRPLPPEVCEPVRRRLNLPRRFILFVGTIEPRKNLVRLLEAFARIDRAALNDQRDDELFLVLAGRRGWMYQPVFAAIDRLNLHDRVQLLDFVADSDLPVVYNLAQVFVYPSLYEGFGLPPLEALACGTPVVTSDNSSLPEVVGNAALLARADDVEALSEGMIRLLKDESLRDRLRRAGLEQARQFRWEASARQIIEHYYCVINGSIA